METNVQINLRFGFGFEFHNQVLKISTQKSKAFGLLWAFPTSQAFMAVGLAHGSHDLIYIGKDCHFKMEGEIHES